VGNALDAFRAQQQAAEQIQARLAEVATLLGQLRIQADALVRNEGLHAVLRQEESWLESARRTVAEVRYWREEERLRYWPGVLRRWVVALAFAVTSAAAVGAGYGWATAPHTGELATLRPRAELALFIEHRIMTMTAAERRQLDALMRWDGGSSRERAPSQ
jgi:hypothetical protein